MDVFLFLVALCVSTIAIVSICKDNNIVKRYQDAGYEQFQMVSSEGIIWKLKEKKK